MELVSERWEEAGLEPEQDPEKPWATMRDGSAWSPRQVAEHALSADEGYARRIREGLGVTVAHPELDTNQGRAQTFPTLSSAQAALDYLDGHASEMSQLIDSLRAEDFASAARIRPIQEQLVAHYGFEASATVEGLLALAAAHWKDHAQQLTTFAAES